MAEGLFTIQEMRPTSSGLVPDGELFSWTSDARAPNGLRGGARAAPKGVWSIGLRQRTSRTDYVGARTPSEQVLGSAWKPFTLSGRWDDRYNFPGFATAEWRRMTNLVGRGPLVRVSYQQVVFDGIITDLDCDYRRSWDISYAFTLSPHQTPALFDLTRSPDTVPSPSQIFDDVDLAVQATLDADAGAPRTVMTGTLAVDTEANLAQMAADRESLAATLDGRERSPLAKPVDAFTRLATQYRAVRASAFDTLVDLGEARSDVDLAVQTAIGVLDFEDWSRSVRFGARLAMGSAYRGDVACSELAAPDAEHFYRPQAGEHLYAISRKFYGTPHAWRLIADRNNLTSFELTGDETLVIPERGD